MSETLDPDDWDEMRTLGHRVVDDVVDYLKTVRERPVWQQIPTETAASFERGLAGGAKWYTDYGLQLSRGFRALKVWLSIKEHGLAKYERLIDQNMEQARYLEGLVESCRNWSSWPLSSSMSSASDSTPAPPTGKSSTN